MPRDLNKLRCIDEAAGSALLHYAMGTLTADEKARFEEHLIECSSCQYELEKHQATLTKLSEDRLTIIEHLRTTDGSEQGEGRRSYLWPVAALAVAASIIAFLLWPKHQSSLRTTLTQPQQVADSTNLSDSKDSIDRAPEPKPPIAPSEGRLSALAVFTPLAYSPINVRSAESNARITFRQGIDYYQKGDFASALKLLMLAQAADTTDTEIGLYAGLTASLAGQFNLSNEILTQALRQRPRPARENQLRWYLAQTALASENRDQAIKHLKELARSTSQYRKDADRLLGELERP